MDKRITLYRYSNETGRFIRENSILVDKSLGLAMISYAFDELTKGINKENSFFLLNVSDDIVEESVSFYAIHTNENGEIYEMTRICPKTMH